MLRLSEFLDIRHVIVASLWVLLAGRLYPPGNNFRTHFSQKLSRTQCHSTARGIKSMKNSSDRIENRTRGLPACSSVPLPTAPTRIEPNESNSHLIVLTTQEQWLELLDSEDGGTAIRWNTCGSLPVDTASHPVKLESTWRPMCKNSGLALLLKIQCDGYKLYVHHPRCLLSN